ncbi:hypothetical protein QYF36_001535 [Acer negundo]|nr:hypothetical protein QYF36_001535 [Acer negundo]
MSNVSRWSGCQNLNKVSFVEVLQGRSRRHQNMERNEKEELASLSWDIKCGEDNWLAKCDAYKLHYLDSEIKGSSLEEGNGSDQDYNNEKKVQKGQQVNVLTKKSSGLANGRDVEGKSVVEDGKVCIQAYNKELKGSKRTLDLNSRKESRLLCPLSCAKKERLLGHDLAWVEFGSHSPSKGSIVKAAVGVFDGKFFFTR